MNNLTVFHGVDHKVGTTMIAQSVAEVIAAARPELKVLWISMQGREGTEYVQEVGESIEGLKLYLDSKVLPGPDLIQNIRKGENLYMLGGVSAVSEERYYFPHTAAYLLSTMEREFDIMIADSGNDVDNGLAMGALEQGGENFLVLTQQESILTRYEKLDRFYFQLGLKFDRFVINKHCEQDPYDMDYIAKRLELDPDQLYKVEETASGRRAEMEYRTLIAYHDERYIADIITIANGILSRQGFHKIEKQRKSKWKDFM